MGISQAQQMLQQLQQQLSNPAFAQQAMSGLAGAGLGAQNPAQFYSTPFDEQVLRQAVLGRVLGYYGSPQMGSVGNPFGIGRGIPIDPFTGGMGQTPDWMQSGFGSKYDWKQAGKPRDMAMQPYGLGGDAQQQFGEGDSRMQLGGGLLGGAFGGVGQLGPARQGRIEDTFGQFNPQGIEQGGFQVPQNFNPQNPFDFFGLMGSQNPNVPALQNDYVSQFTNALSNAMVQSGANNPTSGFTNIPINFSGFGPARQAGFPGLDAGSRQSLDAITQGQLGQADLDFNSQRQQLLNQMFGNGLNQSTVAADAGGRLLYGRQQALNEIMGQAGQREMDARKALLDQQTALIKAGGGGGGGINFLGGGGLNTPGLDGGIIGNLAGNLRMQQAAPQDAMNVLQGFMGKSSPVPLNFEQQMQLADMQLKQAQLAQQGQLGFGQLGLQQQLGLGSQGLEGQQLQQQLLQFILGQGLQRQQSAAGFTQSDLARMQQYLSGQQQLFGGIGQQSAQLEAQKKSFLSQLMGGILGGASALLPGLGSIGQAGGFGSIFH